MRNFEEFFKEGINQQLGLNKPLSLSDVPDELGKIVPVEGDKKKDKIQVNTEASVTVKSLMPAQKEVIPAKALAFALGNFANKQPPLDDMQAIVSSDSYIMDGHHRWAAAILLNPSATVKVAKINLPAADLITALNIYTKGILNQTGNKGTGSIETFVNDFALLLDSAIKNGLPANLDNGKQNWPVGQPFLRADSPDDIKKIITNFGGGNFDNGKKKLLENSKTIGILATKKYPNAPERINMPVIEAGVTVNGEKTSDVTKSQLYAVCKAIENGEMDLLPPFNSNVKLKTETSPTQTNPSSTVKNNTETPTIKTESKIMNFDNFMSKK